MMTSFPVVDPATGETVRKYPAMSREEAHAMVAYEKEPWKSSSASFHCSAR